MILKSPVCLYHEWSFIRHMQFMSISDESCVVNVFQEQHHINDHTRATRRTQNFFSNISVVICPIYPNVIFNSLKYLISKPSQTFTETSLLGDHKISTRIPFSFVCCSQCFIDKCWTKYFLDETVTKMGTVDDYYNQDF